MVRLGTATRVGKAAWTVLAVAGYAATAGSLVAVDLAPWGLALVWGAVWVGGLYAIQRRETRAWRSVADELGFDIAGQWTPYSILWAERPPLEGTVDGRRVSVHTRIDRSGSSWAQPRTVVTAAADADVRFALVPDSRIGPDLGGDIEVGHDAFDRRFRVVAGGSPAIAADASPLITGGDAPSVATPDPERVRAVLDSDVREALLGLPTGWVEVEAGRVTVDLAGKHLDPDRVRRVAETAVRLAARVEA